MNKYLTNLKRLCTPAFVYLVLSVVSILLMAFQNLGNSKKYCVGLYECSVPSTLMIFVFKVFYTLFWTFILNLLCKGGYKELSWFLVILPYLLLFVLIGFLLLNNGAKLKVNKKN